VRRLGGAAALWAVLALAARAAAAQCPDGTPAPCGPRAVRAAPTGVAVLYFDNLSTDSSDAYLAEGITQEIIARLGDVSRLVVKSRYAVRPYRGATTLDPAGIGRALGVAYLVTGSVQRAGRRLLVGAELSRASTGDRVWGQEYERGDGDIIAIMADIASHVVAGVAGSLLPAERRALASRPTESRAAYDQLLRGDVLLAQRTPVSVRGAVAAYAAATALDPALADAWARMSVAYGILVQRGWTPDGRPADDSLRERSIAAADRALALDSSNSDAWMAEAYARTERDPLGWEGAEAGYRRAVALNPRNAEAWHQLGDLLGAMGRRVEALDAWRAAVRAEPGRPVSMLSLASTLAPREALAVCDSVLAVDPQSVNAYMIRALDRLAAGDTTGARSDLAGLERVVPLGAELGSRALAARLVLALGDTADARRRARDLESGLPVAGPIHPQLAAMLAAVLYLAGERDEAFALLSRAPPGVAVWQNRGGAPWLADARFRRVFDESRPAWASAP